MNNTELNSKQRAKRSFAPSFAVTLAGVVLMVIGLFLPYITAVGDTKDYIEEHPHRIEVESMDVTADELERLPLISLNKLITGAYGEDEGLVESIIIWIICGFLAITALFAIFKKPIGVMIFDLLIFGLLCFNNFVLKEDCISDDRYAWSIGYYLLLFAAVVTFVGAIWLLITKRI